MTLLIPDFMGGPSAGRLPKNSKVADLLRQNGYPETQISNFPSVCQPITGNRDLRRDLYI